MKDYDLEVYKADKHIKDQLKKLPESGMGYQVIKAKDSGSYYVFNGEYLVPEQQYEKFLLYVRHEELKSFDDLNLQEFKTELNDIRASCKITSVITPSKQLFD